MKKIAFLSMGLLACVAFSPQSASAAPDTGPQVDNMRYEQEQTSATGTHDIAFMAVRDEANIFIISSYTRINDAVPEQSDHPAASNEDVKKYLVIEEGITTVASVNGNLLSSDVNISALAAVDDRQRPCYESMIMNGYSTLDLDLENSTGLATAAALHSHLTVWVMKRPAWTPALLC